MIPLPKSPTLHYHLNLALRLSLLAGGVKEQALIIRLHGRI